MIFPLLRRDSLKGGRIAMLKDKQQFLQTINYFLKIIFSLTTFRNYYCFSTENFETFKQNRH